ncbi:WXG100 family type VII secretion target [Streptomyces sp. NPDC021093]|uniref:WXG100 family type VII secretion target n=1 Tax=Streptomyces sp. NPDC021093 TaxID=3365112 RepID=UPI00378DEBF3
MINTRVLPAALLAAALGSIALAPAACAAAAPTGLHLAAQPSGHAAPTDETPDSSTGLSAELDDMKSLIQKIAGSYEGEASESWQRQQNEWSAATAELHDIVNATQSSLGTPSEAAAK